MNGTFSRRDFLKGSIFVAAGALGSMALSGCSGSASGGDSSSGTEDTSASQADMVHAVTLHRGYAAAHGDKCFTQVVVAVNDEGTIVATSVDDYQFMDSATDGIVAVPNSDSDFAQGYAEGKTLISKSDNSDVYSQAMASKGGATQKWLVSMAAIEAFAVGKKPADLTTVGADAVSGATLQDTVNYLKAIATVAADTAIVTEGSYEGDGTDLKIGRINDAAHGTKAFADAVSLVQGSTIVAASIDEFQFLSADAAGVVGVPNSDKAFGENYASGVVLGSKSVNNTVYSEMIKAKANGTTEWLASMEAIEAAISGHDMNAIDIAGPDAVSGATLQDTAKYVQSAISAAKSA